MLFLFLSSLLFVFIKSEKVNGNVFNIARFLVQYNKPSSITLIAPLGSDDEAKIIMQEANINALNTYNKLIEMGVCREQARGILPQNMFTTFWATVDLRNLLHFIELRDDSHAQKEIREYAKAMKELIRPYVPHVVEYFENK